MYIYTADREQELLGRYEENAYLCAYDEAGRAQKTYLYEFEGFSHGDMPGPGFQLMLKQLNADF